MSFEVAPVKFLMITDEKVNRQYFVPETSLRGADDNLEHLAYVIVDRGKVIKNRAGYKEG